MIPIFSAKKAIRDFNKNMIGFEEIQSRMRANQPPQQEMPQAEPQISLDQMLMSQGLPATLSVKMAQANKLGLKNYNGSVDHDNLIMNTMNSRAVNKQATDQVNNDNNFKDREFGLKEKELGIKEKELEANKFTADDVADSLISKI
jgi:hypothetical protein